MFFVPHRQMKFLSISGRSLTLRRTWKLVKTLNAYQCNKIELSSTLSGMVIATFRKIVLFCQLLFLVTQPCCMCHNGSSFQIISSRAWKTIQFPFWATKRLQVTQLYLFVFVDPLYNSSTLLLHYRGIFLGRKLVNEFCEFFRAVRLKTVVCHTDITSRKVIHLFCFIERGRQCSVQKSLLHGYNWVVVYNF